MGPLYVDGSLRPQGRTGTCGDMLLDSFHAAQEAARGLRRELGEERGVPWAASLTLDLSQWVSWAQRNISVRLFLHLKNRGMEFVVWFCRRTRDLSSVTSCGHTVHPVPDCVRVLLELWSL